MNTETNHRIRLGIFVIAGSVLLVAGFYLIGQNKNIFGSTLTLVTRFDNIGGLQVGNNVRFSGIDVGTVKSINILNDTTIEVAMTIDDEMQSIMRKNAIATIGTDGLMGNKLVSIEPGSADHPFVEDGDRLESEKALDTERMLKTLASTNLNVEHISSNLIELTDRINLSRGTLYTMLMDTNAAAQLQSTIFNIQDVSKNLSDFSERLSVMTRDVSSGKGALGALVNDSTKVNIELREMVSNLNVSSKKIETAVTQVSMLLDQLQNGKGSAAAIINDTVMSRQLKRSIANIDSSAEKLNQNMEALKHNFLTRGYFKKLEKSSEHKKESPIIMKHGSK